MATGNYYHWYLNHLPEECRRGFPGVVPSAVDKIVRGEEVRLTTCTGEEVREIMECAKALGRTALVVCLQDTRLR